MMKIVKYFVLFIAIISIAFYSSESFKAIYNKDNSHEVMNVFTTYYDDEMTAENYNISKVARTESQNEMMFSEDFSKDLILTESGLMGDSKSSNWWVNSGAFLFVREGVGRTIHGEIDANGIWQIKYKDYNASETDDGYHPQNIFRLVTKSQWLNFTQEAYYRINKYHHSTDKHRSASNGLLLFNRYQDGNNLYYTGIRVDGTAVIKKKIKGEYYTLAQEPIFEGMYDRKKNPNLLPIGEWIGVRSEVITENDGSVRLKVFIDRDRTGLWTLVVEAIDENMKYGGAVISDEGYAGIRTDFMDAEFDDYRIQEIDKL